MAARKAVSPSALRPCSKQRRARAVAYSGSAGWAGRVARGGGGVPPCGGWRGGGGPEGVRGGGRRDLPGPADRRRGRGPGGGGGRGGGGVVRAGGPGDGHSDGRLGVR